MSDAGGEDLPEHVAANRGHWDEMAHEWVASGERAWASDDPSWGIWSVPESELEMLPAHMTGLDAIEMGCGTAYVSGWMARRGATVTGIDNSAAQLAVEIDPGGVNFCLPVSEWVALFRLIGFTIDDLREPRAPESAQDAEFFVDAEWAKRWPSELVWKVRKG